MGIPFDSQVEEAHWRAASSQLVAVATVVDNRLVGGAVPPLRLAGGFVLATSAVAERCENVLTRIGQHRADDLPDETWPPCAQPCVTCRPLELRWPTSFPRWIPTAAGSTTLRFVTPPATSRNAGQPERRDRWHGGLVW